jgi:hypothetical protein
MATTTPPAQADLFLRRTVTALPDPPPKAHPDFHNTSGLNGKELVKARRKAQTQASAVSNLFQNNPSWERSARDVHRLLGGDRHALLTSIRRTLTGLEQSGVLVRTKQRMGVAGAPEWLYMLAPRWLDHGR